MPDTSLQSSSSSLPGLLSTENVRKRFNEILGERGPAFASSILSLYNSNQQLRDCDPQSIVAAAAVAATLDLPINQSLGRAFIVPYGKQAQFQLGAKGFIELALRTGKYKTIHATEVYKDEIARWDPLTGEFSATDPSGHKMRINSKPEDLAGYMAFFRMTNGFEKYFYLTIEQLTAHGKKYSKSYDHPNALWKQNPHVMRMKTVIKLLLSKYGMLSIQMEKAIETDQAVIDTEGRVFYPDRREDEPVATKPTGADRKLNDNEFKLLCAEQDRAEKRGIDKEEQKLYMVSTFGTEHRHDLTVEQLSAFVKWLKQEPGGVQ